MRRKGSEGLTGNRCTVFSGRGFLGLPQKGISSHRFGRSPVPFIIRAAPEKSLEAELKVAYREYPSSGSPDHFVIL